MPAALSAAVLATAMCPSTREETAGWSPVTRSMSWRVGSFSPTPGCGPSRRRRSSRRRRRLGMLGNALLHLRQRLHADQVDLQQLLAAGGQMQVRIVEAGHDEVSAEIDDFGVAAFQFANVVVRADGDDASVTDCHGLGASRRGLGVDVAVEEDHVGRTSALGIAGCGFA